MFKPPSHPTIDFDCSIGGNSDQNDPPFFSFQTMSLIMAPSALAVCPEFPDILLAAVGPFIQVFLNSTQIAEHLLFPLDKRIVGLIHTPFAILTYSEDLLKIFTFSPDFSSFTVLHNHSFIDWIVTAKSFSPEFFCVVLRHGQFLPVSPSNVESRDPPVWKIATSALILDDSHYFIGDLFGSVTFVSRSEYLKGNSSFGAVFGIDFDPINRELLTAHESHFCVRWKLTENSIEKTWEISDHTSRVWGCLFFSHSPISFGEDGCVHIYDGTNRVLHLHRTKNITAFVANGKEIITAGQNGIIRRFVISEELPIIQEVMLCEEPPKRREKSPLTPLCVTILENYRIVIGTAGGMIIVLPEHHKVFQSDDDIGGFYQIVSFHHKFLAVSKNRWLLVGHDLESCNCFQDPSNSMAVSLGINSFFLVVVHSDHKLRVMSHDGIPKAILSLDGFFMKPPRAMAVHPSSLTIALGGHSTRVCVIEIGEDFNAHTDSIVVSASNEGFQGMFFSEKLLYCAGRSDGTVSICAKFEGRWVLKSAWQIPAQAKTTVHIQASPYQSAIISSFIGHSVGLWDVATQTLLVSFHGDAQRGHFAIWAGDGIFSAAWIDKTSKVSFIDRGSSLSCNFLGVRFHGLRGLSGAKISEDLLVTGSCDRDVRVWRISNEKIECVDEVQGTDSGTHAVCAVSDLVFTGGSRGVLFVWRIDVETGFLYRQLMTTICAATAKCKLRITAMSVSPSLQLLVALSDASLSFYQYLADETGLKFISTRKLNGVGVSADYQNGTFAIGTTRGECHFFGDITGNSSLHQSGIHCLKLFKHCDVLYVASAADDGTVGVWRVHQTGSFPVLAVKKGHIGGVKAISVNMSENNCWLCSFSYDQVIQLHLVNLVTGRVMETKKLTASIADGEMVEFFRGGLIVFGSGIQFLPLYPRSV
jgi:WD40 repeat protein